MSRKKTSRGAEYARTRRERLRGDGKKLLNVAIDAEIYPVLQRALADSTDDAVNLMPLFCGAIINEWARQYRPDSQADYVRPTPEQAQAISSAILSTPVGSESLKSRVLSAQLVHLIQTLSNDETGPTIAEIAAALAAHNSTTSRAIRILVERGIVIRHSRVSHNGAARSSVYSLSPHAIANLAAAAKAEA